jgi:hypothetical protein
MAYSFAPWVEPKASGVARFEATGDPTGPPGLVQEPPMKIPPDADFLAAVGRGFETVCRVYPALGRARVAWCPERFPPGHLPMGGKSIYGVSVLVFAKLVAELFPTAAKADVRGLRVDRIGITATPGDRGRFAPVGDGSIERKLEALAVIKPISVAVVPRGQPGLSPNGEINEFRGPLGLSLSWVAFDDPWECIRCLYLLQARSILVRGA